MTAFSIRKVGTEMVAGVITRTPTPVQCALRVPGYRPFPFDAQFFDFREPSRSHAAGHGLNDRPGCNNLDPLSHGTASTVSEQQHHA